MKWIQIVITIAILVFAALHLHFSSADSPTKKVQELELAVANITLKQREVFGYHQDILIRVSKKPITLLKEYIHKLQAVTFELSALELRVEELEYHGVSVFEFVKDAKITSGFLEAAL